MTDCYVDAVLSSTFFYDVDTRIIRIRKVVLAVKWKLALEKFGKICLKMICGTLSETLVRDVLKVIKREVRLKLE